VTDTISCADCGTVVERRGYMHKYCELCSTERHITRQREWARQNGHRFRDSDKKRRQAMQPRIVEAFGQAGVANSEREPIHWNAARVVNLAWAVRIAYPFSYAMSKNHIYRFSQKGHVFLRSESRAKKEGLEIVLRNALKSAGVTVRSNRVWLDIFVQKPNHKGDAINVLDLVADAAKKSLGLDDRWFSIRRLDWEITKGRGMLYLGVGQEDVPDVQACSICGRLLELSAFTKSKGSKNGVGRECLECRRLASKIARGADPRNPSEPLEPDPSVP
jgi:hypothetical protein